MRRLIATACCLLVLSFGVLSEAAHVHRSSDHHEEARGLHLDHVHPAGAADAGRLHGHEPHHRHDRHNRSDPHAHDDVPRAGGTATDARHAGHHDGDAVYVGASAFRAAGSKSGPAPALASIAPLVEPPGPGTRAPLGEAGGPRAPPWKAPPRMRAPPA